MFETTNQGNYGKAVYYCLPNPNPIWISTFRKCSLEFRDMMQNDAQLKGHLSRREERPFHPPIRLECAGMLERNSKALAALMRSSTIPSGNLTLCY